MFLASDQVIYREHKIRKFMGSDPGISLVLAAVNFEWTVCRAILFLSATPNVALREKMANYFSLEKYKQLWKEEIATPKGGPTLPIVVTNWDKVREAFCARNRLVHGRDRYTRNMATPHVEALLKGVASIDSYCERAGIPLHARMPVRQRKVSG